MVAVSARPKGKMPAITDDSKEVKDQDYQADYDTAAKEYEKQVEKEEEERLKDVEEAKAKRKKELKELADMKDTNNCAPLSVSTANKRLHKKAIPQKGTLTDKEYAALLSVRHKQVSSHSRYTKVVPADQVGRSTRFRKIVPADQVGRSTKFRKIVPADQAGRSTRFRRVRPADESQPSSSEKEHLFPVAGGQVNGMGEFFPDNKRLSSSAMQVVPADQVQPSKTFRLKQLDDSKEKKKNTYLPHIYKNDETYEKEKLKATLMTQNKFNKDFPDQSWEDANYVPRISEYSKQDLKARMQNKQKQVGSIKKSFIGDVKHNEYPEMQAQSQDA